MATSQMVRQQTTNLLPALEASLSPSRFAFLKSVAEEASRTGTPLYIVGGSVRDLLLGRPFKDLDLVVEGDAGLLAFEVSKELTGDVTAHSRFGTATIKLDGHRFDLATARREIYEAPGALPVVTPSNIQEDLGRRDFSINSMAIAISGRQTGCLLDPHGGSEDLGQRLIRVLHPDSFGDDPTRILRAVRYEQRLHFRLESDTERLLLEGVEASVLDSVSGDRIRQELALILQEAEPAPALSRCDELGILRAIFPPIKEGVSVSNLAGRAPARSSLVYLAALSYGLATQEGEAFIRRLRMPSRWAKVVRDTIALNEKCGAHPSGGPHIGEPGFPPSQLCEFLDQLSPASIEGTAALSDSPAVKEALKLYLTELRYLKPDLNGDDVISLGATPGPLVGEVLRELRRARVERCITSRDEEIRLSKEYISMKGGRVVDGA